MMQIRTSGRALSVTFLTSFLLLVLSTPGLGQESFGFTEHAILYDNWRTTGCPVVIGDYTYVPSGTHLRVLDTSDPSNVQDAFETPEDLRFLCDFLLRIDDHLWCFNNTINDTKIRVVNVENPDSPYLEMTHEIAFRSTTQAEHQGDYIYLSSAFQYFGVLDISNPHAPVLVDVIHSARSDANIYNDKVYMTNYNYDEERMKAEIYYFDEDSDTLIAASSFADTLLSASPVRLEITLDYLIIQSGTTIHLFDLIASPEDPEYLACLEIETMGEMKDALVIDDKLYLTAGQLYVIDIADSMNPILVQEFDQFDPRWLMLDASGQNLLINSDTRNTIVDISSLDTETPDILYDYMAQRGAIDVELDYPYAYVAFVDSVVIYNMEDINRITHVATITENVGAKCLEIEDDYLFVGISYGCFSIFYIHDQASPQFITTINSSYHQSLRVLLEDDILYVMSGWDELEIYNLGTYMTHGEVMQIGSDANEIYDGVDALHIVEYNNSKILVMSQNDGVSHWVTVDVTDPTAPTYLHDEYVQAELPHTESAYFVGDTLNIITANGCWGQIDFGNPYEPELLDVFNALHQEVIPYYIWPIYALYQEPYWLMSVYNDAMEPLVVLNRHEQNGVPVVDCVERFGRAKNFDICEDALGYVDNLAVHLFSRAKEAGVVKEELAIELPDTPELAEPFPNPFNPSVTIPFTLPEAGEVEIAVFNLLGQQVTTLTHTHFTAGHHSLIWDASAEGFEAPSGVYFVRMKAGGQVQTRKVMLLK